MSTPDGRGSRLGALWALYGVVRLIAALVLIMFGGTATLMFGALLSRVPNPFALMDDFHVVYACVVIWAFASGILALVAAADFLGRRRSAPSVAILAAFLALPDLPFGVMLGVYTLILMLPGGRAVS
jgi:hypothetical protein